MAKVALDMQAALERRRRTGEAGTTTSRILARGAGWSVADVICTAGPRDRPFEERHAQHSIAVVLSGSFQYRTTTGGGVMTPGAIMLGNPGQCFECGHAHGEGDHCVAFWFSPDYFERIVADAGVRGRLNFRTPRLPPVRAMAPLVAAAGVGTEVERSEAAWEELGILLLGEAVQSSGDVTRGPRTPPHAEARVSAAVRAIEAMPDAPHTLASLAAASGVSPFHFLRTFRQVAGVTPHQYVLRARLRAAAWQLATPTPVRILDVALDSGFGEASNFDRAFRTEFGVSPRAYRQRFVEP
ncbi:Regulatory protein SoxS [Luteitalea pratensis]|uniref:Regulatory protein SoxS n=1 Tax=Luteitalea pratensis TaxID=1855912 RepID=A0A143PMZ4_LUTPR|nr:AraC family transcriptional regulator [Luteitalea pratensis]AMY09139.1 Regulatory protein SoxS [Luteitalea pratensis]